MWRSETATGHGGWGGCGVGDVDGGGWRGGGFVEAGGEGGEGAGGIELCFDRGTVVGEFGGSLDGAGVGDIDGRFAIVDDDLARELEFGGDGGCPTPAGFGIQRRELRAEEALNRSIIGEFLDFAVSGECDDDTLLGGRVFDGIKKVIGKQIIAPEDARDGDGESGRGTIGALGGLGEMVVGPELQERLGIEAGVLEAESGDDEGIALIGARAVIYLDEDGPQSARADGDEAGFDIVAPCPGIFGGLAVEDNFFNAGAEKLAGEFGRGGGAVTAAAHVPAEVVVDHVAGRVELGERLLVKRGEEKEGEDEGEAGHLAFGCGNKFLRQ